MHAPLSSQSLLYPLLCLCLDVLFFFFSFSDTSLLLMRYRSAEKMWALFGGPMFLLPKKLQNSFFLRLVSPFLFKDTRILPFNTHHHVHTQTYKPTINISVYIISSHPDSAFDVKYATLQLMSLPAHSLFEGNQILHVFIF